MHDKSSAEWARIDAETRGRGDTGKRRHGDGETRRSGDPAFAPVTHSYGGQVGRRGERKIEIVGTCEEYKASNGGRKVYLIMGMRFKSNVIVDSEEVGHV